MSVFRAFEDRGAAGRALAGRLSRYKGPGTLVLALPRGGVPVAGEIAEALGARLDVMLVRKVGVPGHEELAVAAITGGAVADIVINTDVARMCGLDASRIEALAEPERIELERRRARYLGTRQAAPIAGRTVIVADDGVAPGATLKAALRAVRRCEPERVIVAVPVAPADTVGELEALADRVVVLATPEPFMAVGAHYRQFAQVSDDAVIAELEAARARLPVQASGGA